MSLDSHYRVLGVGQDVDEKTLKKVYRSLIRKNHPDVSNDPNAEEITIKIITAYETVLADLIGPAVIPEPAQKEPSVSNHDNSKFEFEGEIFDLGMDLSFLMTAEIRENLDRIAQNINKPTFVGDHFDELYYHVTEVSGGIKERLSEGRSPYSAEETGRSLGEDIVIQDEMIELITRVYLSNVSGAISQGDLEQVTELDLSSLSLDSISDLRHFTKLEVLDLSDTTIDRISDLGDIAQVKQLYAAGCDSIPLDLMTRLQHLELLDVAGNKIADIEPIAQLTCLTDLMLYDNNIVDLDSVGVLRNLRRLDLSLNPIKDISILRQLPNLEYLNLNWTRVDDFTPILDIPSIRFVDVSYYNDAVLERNSWIWEQLRQRDVFVKTELDD